MSIAPVHALGIFVTDLVRLVTDVETGAPAFVIVATAAGARYEFDGLVVLSEFNQARLERMLSRAGQERPQTSDEWLHLASLNLGLFLLGPEMPVPAGMTADEFALDVLHSAHTDAFAPVAVQLHVVDDESEAVLPSASRAMTVYDHVIQNEYAVDASEPHRWLPAWVGLSECRACGMDSDWHAHLAWTQLTATSA